MLKQSTSLKSPMLVELIPGEHPHIILDILYATKNNFMHEVLYPYPACFVHQKVKKALIHIADELSRMGLGIKIFDGYRPLSVQKKMWDQIQDERFVANPYKMGGRHTRGTAVDVTLVDKQGKELQMPTPFDSFEERAHSEFANLPKRIVENRRLLRKMMEKHGFISIPTEWWHYDLKGWEDETLYPCLDLSFQELQEALQTLSNKD